jgi:hypothetical protein
MAKQNINVGTTANDKKGDSLRAAFVKVNSNFTELYTALGINADVTLNLGAFEFAGSVMSTTDSTAIVIDQATTITSNLSVGGDILPQTANGGDLGSSTLPWRSLYVSNNTIYIGGVAVGLDANGNLTTGGTVVGSTPAWANITGKPTIPTSFSKLVSGSAEVVLITEGPEPFTVFPAISTNDQLQIVGSEVGAVSGVLTLTSQTDTLILSNGAGVGGGLKVWTFGSDGALTIPGDIKSEGNINIDINLADSTLRRWQFGEDGNLETPGGIQVAGILKIDDGVHEKLQTKADATGTVTHDCSLGHIFYHTSPDANWTANFLNLNLSSGYATSVTLVIEQGATGYYPSAFRIDYMVHAIKWQGNTTPTPSTNRTDVVTFSIICTATDTYTVLGQLTGF